MKIVMYILNEHGDPEPCDDLITWGKWMQESTRTLTAEELGDIMVSTVFLGLDHNYSGEGPPILWETMVFGGLLDGEQRRYTSREDAEAGHKEMLARVMESLGTGGEEDGA